DDPTQPGALAARHLAPRHRDGVEATRLERRQEVATECLRVPGDEAPHVSLARDTRDDLGHVAERADPVEHAADPLELPAEAFERGRPALDELAPERLGDRTRLGGPRGGPGGKEAPGLRHLPVDPW